MKYFIISLMLSLPIVSVHAQSLESEQDSVVSQEVVEASIHEKLDKEIENIQKQTKSIKHNLHPEIVKNLPAIEQEAILALLKSQREDLKALDILLRESFNNLDPALQRDILLRLSER